MKPTYPLSLKTASQDESLKTNVARLKEYSANLIIFPRGSQHKPKKGDSPVADQAAAKQVRNFLAGLRTDSCRGGSMNDLSDGYTARE